MSRVRVEERQADGGSRSQTPIARVRDKLSRGQSVNLNIWESREKLERQFRWVQIRACPLMACKAMMISRTYFHPRSRICPPLAFTIIVDPLQLFMPTRSSRTVPGDLTFQGLSHCRHHIRVIIQLSTTAIQIWWLIGLLFEI